MESLTLSIREKELKSNLTGYSILLKYFKEIELKIKSPNIKFLNIDLEGVTSFDLNLFAILSSKCNEYSKRLVRVRIKNISKELFKKLESYEFPLISGKTKNDTLKYVEFKSNQYIKFDRYIQNILESDNYNLPQMTNGLKNKIKSGLGEVFGNVSMHTESPVVFVCGQINLEVAKRLDITIVNIGRTIKENVLKYCKITDEEVPESCIDWCSINGNTTKIEKTGGLGLAILKEFVKKNDGKLQILSDNEYWEYGNKSVKKKFKDLRFNGTIVNVEFNLNDLNSYRLKNEINVNDIF